MSEQIHNKIFCIGPNRTGTCSLRDACTLLGFKTAHYECEIGNIKEIIQENSEAGRKLLAGLEDYDAFFDWDYPETYHLFKQFDEQYPKSKFILTTRDLDSWLQSRERHVLSTRNLKHLQNEDPLSTWYHVDRPSWRREYNRIHESSLSYFKDRPGDLLVMDVTKGEGWGKLCPFLGVPVPEQPFPHVNYRGWTEKMTSLYNRFWYRPPKARLDKDESSCS